MQTEDSLQQDILTRISELEAWLKLVRQGNASMWDLKPLGLDDREDWKPLSKTVLPDDSLTAEQEKRPHCVALNHRIFANETEYLAYVEEEKTWAAKHYPPGVEVIPVTTVKGQRTVVLLGLTAQQANAINVAIEDKQVLEQKVNAHLAKDFVNKSAINDVIDTEAFQQKVTEIASAMGGNMGAETSKGKDTNPTMFPTTSSVPTIFQKASKMDSIFR